MCVCTLKFGDNHRETIFNRLTQFSEITESLPPEQVMEVIDRFNGVYS